MTHGYFKARRPRQVAFDMPRLARASWSPWASSSACARRALEEVVRRRSGGLGARGLHRSGRVVGHGRHLRTETRITGVSDDFAELLTAIPGCYFMLGPGYRQDAVVRGHSTLHCGDLEALQIVRRIQALELIGVDVFKPRHVEMVSHGACLQVAGVNGGGDRGQRRFAISSTHGFWPSSVTGNCGIAIVCRCDCNLGK